MRGRSLPPDQTCGEIKAGVESASQLTEAGRGWPKLEAALCLIWRWRGVLEGELADACMRSGRLVSTEGRTLSPARTRCR